MADIVAAAWDYRMALEEHSRAQRRVAEAQDVLNDAMKAEAIARVKAEEALVALGSAAELSALPVHGLPHQPTVAEASHG